LTADRINDTLLLGITMAIETNNRVQLTRQELEALIDAEARRRLGMSGREFKRKYAQGKLPETTTVRDIAMLVKLAA
jgi:hypothetical protein